MSVHLKEQVPLTRIKEANTIYTLVTYHHFLLIVREQASGIVQYETD